MICWHFANVGQLQILQFTFNKNCYSYEKIIDNILSVNILLYLWPKGHDSKCFISNHHHYILSSKVKKVYILTFYL